MDLNDGTVTSARVAGEGEMTKKIKPPRKKNAEKRQQNKMNKGNFNKNNDKQLEKQFNEHKQAILSNLNQSACDLSPKGSVDVKCLPIMKILNEESNDYVTTSSCSGRIALFHSSSDVAAGDDVVGKAKNDSEEGADEAKQTDDSSEIAGGQKKMKRGHQDALGWILVKHGILTSSELRRVVYTFCGKPKNEEEEKLDAEFSSKWDPTNDVECISAHCRKNNEDVEIYRNGFKGEFEGVMTSTNSGDDNDDNESFSFTLPLYGTISLKMEPYVMHVECRHMEGAKKLLTAAVSDGGYRNSGVVPPGRKIMCGIRCTTGLGMEVPLVLHGHNYVRDNRKYLWELLNLANEKMFDNEKRTLRLENSLKTRLKQ